MTEGDKQSGNIHQQAGDGAIQIGQARDVFIRPRIYKISSYNTEQQRARRNRLAMLQLVRNTWIKGVLEQSLHGAAMIELGMEERTDAVEKPWDMIVQMPDREDRVLPPSTRMVDVFDETGGALLILGEPGSGKTTMLLELTHQTIERAEEYPTQPIPVVFNLSSWAVREQAIADWLVDEMRTKYNIPKKIAKSWIWNDELLLLLDGLDEVKTDRQEACVKAINKFHQEHLVPLAVCSRLADYEALTGQLKLQGAVVLRPLTKQQIDQYLSGIGVELQAVQESLKRDLALQELAKSPLTLSIMTLAYRGMSLERLQALQRVEDRRKHLFSTYVQRMFQRRGVDERYSPKKTIFWLTWLAQRMTERAQSVFLIEKMQPGWLQKTFQRGVYTILVGLIGGLIVGLIVELALGPLVGLIVGLIFGLDVGLGLGLSIELFWGPLIGLFGGLVSWLRGGLIAWSTGQLESLIQPVEGFEWSWRKAKQESISILKLCLRIGLSVGLSIGLIVGLIFEPTWGLLAGPPSGLISVLSVGLIRLIETLAIEEVEIRTVPNQGIRQSAKNFAITVLAIGVFFGLIGGLSFGLLFELISRRIGGIGVGLSTGLIGGLIGGLFFGLFFGLFGGLSVGGGFAVILHFALRLTLFLTGQLPLRLVTFLDYATERIFLRKVGGGYIFIHRTIQEYFASLEPEQ